MTAHQIRHQNAEVLNQVASAVDQVAAGLARLGRLQESLYTAKETVDALSAENERLRSNSPAIEKKERTSRLRNNLSSLEIEVPDRDRLEVGVKSAKTALVAAGHAVRSIASELLHQLVTCRLKNAHTALNAILAPVSSRPTLRDLAPFEPKNYRAFRSTILFRYVATHR